MLGLIGVEDVKEFSLLNASVECSIYNLIVNCKVELNYKNTTGQTTDALFSFPHEPNWIAHDFQSIVGANIIVGRYKEVDEAKKLHKAAIDSGQREIVIEDINNAMNSSKWCVGNVPNGSEVRISVKFVAELALSVTKTESEDVDRFTFLLPIIARPRYSTDGQTGDDKIFHVPNQFEYIFTASITGSKVIRNVVSNNNYPMTLNYTNNKRTHAQVTLQSKYDGFKDLTFSIDYTKTNIFSVYYENGSDHNDKREFCKTNLAVVDLVPRFPSKKMEIIFLVDRSDSMCGADMQQAKRCVLYFLNNIPSNCMFQIYGYGSYFDKAFIQPQNYSADSVKVATNYQSKMSADFDLTDFMLPLKNLFSYPLDDDYERVIFFLTDGDVDNRDEVIKLIKENNASTTLYSFGLGPGVNAAFMRKLAAAGNGEASIIKSSVALYGKFVEIFDNAIKLNPLIADKIEWQCPKNVTVITVPVKPEPIFVNNYLRIFCKVKNLNKGDIIKGNVTTTYNGRQRVFPIEIYADEVVVDNNFTAHLLLSKYIMDQLTLEVENGNDESKKALTRLSCDANIGTKYTKLISVDRNYPNKGLLVPEMMDPLLYYKPLFQMQNFSKKRDKNSKASGDSVLLRPKQIWIRSDVKETTYGNILIFIADKQNIDGSWDYDPHLIWRLGLTAAVIDENQPEFIGKEIWMTIIVFEFLATKLKATHKEWQLLGKKAKEHICISIKESEIIRQVQSSNKFGHAYDANTFIMHLIDMALFILNEAPTALSQITEKEIDGASSHFIAQRKKYEIVFVIDRSGSMHGTKMESSKQCLYIFLKSLPDNCKFQIYGFGTNFDKAFIQYQEYNDDSIHLGLTYQSKMDASFNNTELLNPLRDLYASPLSNGYTRLVFILTDGKITKENEVINLVRKYNKTNKVYAIGIGADVSKTLVNRLAEAGLGKASFVLQTSVLSQIVVDLLQEALFAQ